MVVEADHLRKGYGDRLLMSDLEFKLPPGQAPLCCAAAAKAAGR